MIYFAVTLSSNVCLQAEAWSMVERFRFTGPFSLSREARREGRGNQTKYFRCITLCIQYMILSGRRHNWPYYPLCFVFLDLEEQQKT